jgi:carbamoyl-phosphate synthase large subunit
MKNLGFKLYATKNTHLFLKSKGVETILVSKAYEGMKPNVVDIIKNHEVSLVINLSQDYYNGNLFAKEGTDGYHIRRATIDSNIPLITDLNAARFFVKSIDKYEMKDFKIKSWGEYL